MWPRTFSLFFCFFKKDAIELNCTIHPGRKTPSRVHSCLSSLSAAISITYLHTNRLLARIAPLSSHHHLQPVSSIRTEVFSALCTAIKRLEYKALPTDVLSPCPYQCSAASAHPSRHFSPAEASFREISHLQSTLLK